MLLLGRLGPALAAPRGGKARVGWSEHPQAEQMLLKKLHQASTAMGVSAVELDVSWRPALESKALALNLLQSEGK